ncbi:hypothetical protein HID58_055519, partial [Brassica napus]
FLEFNIHRKQKLTSASAGEVAATAVLPPSFVGEVAAMCCFKLPECGGSDPTQQTAIDNFMVHELMEPKTSGAGAIKSLESM